MQFTSEFVPLTLSELRRQAAVMKADGWRFIETHAALGEAGVDLYYAFMGTDGRIVNYRIAGVTKDTPVPSITDIFLAAFVFENEARELFGVDMRDIAIDFAGALYAPAVAEPMTIITPEQKAAREKARKAAAAKAAKEAAAEDGAQGGSAESNAGAGGGAAPGARVFVMTPELQARLDKKLANMPPEKVAKVEAALAARRAEAEAAAGAAVPAAEASASPGAPGEQSAKAVDAKPAAESAQAPAVERDAVLEEKIAGLDAEKAAKVRAALAGTLAAPATEAVADEPPAGQFADEQLAALIGLMDEKSAATVRAALARKGGE